MEYLTDEWLEEYFMTKEPAFYWWLYPLMFNRKAILVPVGCIKFNTKFKYNKNAP